MKAIFIMILMIQVQSFITISNEYINLDGGEWLTIDSALAYNDSGGNGTSIEIIFGIKIEYNVFFAKYFENVFKLLYVLFIFWSLK